jgi:hypothetical protein
MSEHRSALSFSGDSAILQNKGVHMKCVVFLMAISATCFLQPFPAFCEADSGYFRYKEWTVSEPVLQAGPAGTFDDVSVKDPSIVFHDGKYHLFYTSKASREASKNYKHLSKGRSAVVYVASETLEGLQAAKRYNLDELYEYVIVAPQVFYFAPQKLWYLVAHTLVDARPDLMPIYMTNPDVGDVHGWSTPKELKTCKSNNGFWIDFWVICDDAKAHLFYTDHEGGMFRFECPLDTFPEGFAKEREETVLAIRGEDEKGRWRLHEGSHIYYVTEENKYLALLEGVYPHPTRKNYWDSRSRFMFAMVADKLEGPWRRVEREENDFAGDPKHLFNADGSRNKYDQVSHFELIRSGCDQKLEIKNYKLDLLFQAFDADGMDSDYDYNDLPWELMLMRNYK